MSKREEIAPNGDKRYIRRDDRHKAKADAKPGEGDRGDHRASK
jgi:hypothetical protein